jgi:hypothetical protein
MDAAAREKMKFGRRADAAREFLLTARAGVC